MSATTSPRPARLGDLRSGTVDTRYVDFSDDLGPLADPIATATVTAARRDGFTSVIPPDLAVTPAGHTSPWLTESGYPGVLTRVNFWLSADASNPGADYVVTVAVTTSAGRDLIVDTYQEVVPITG